MDNVDERSPSDDSVRLLVVETNEIPLSLIRWYGERKPSSTLAALLREGAVGQTRIEEECGRELYPSQTWATLATGVPFEKHGVYWYGDPKPPEFPLYWQHAARHRSVGIVGTLHSSPLAEQGDRAGLRFALPDAFASDADALPRSLSPLQAFNLSMTRSNSRAVSSRLPIADYARGVSTLGGSGVRPRTVARLAALAATVAAGRAPKERLRTGQFLLLGDVFLRLVQDHDPDLSVFFTNHVAAAMHRYWPASFPDDWDPHPYDPAWIERFAGEIPAALDALDGFLGTIRAFCARTDRTMVIVSSMGQEGGGPVDEGGSAALVIDDGRLLATELGVQDPFEVLQAMTPHVSLKFESAEAAMAAERRLVSITLDDRPLVVHRSGNTVTLTYHLGSDPSAVLVDAVEREPGSLGMRRVAVSEHKAGRHMPEGLLLSLGPDGRQPALPDDPVDVMEVAPALLGALGLDPLDHHRRPTIRFA